MTFELYLSDDILKETGRVLLTDERNRRRYGYAPEQVIEYWGLARLATIVPEVPEIEVMRDLNDDMILACAIAASAQNLTECRPRGATG